MPNAYSRTKEAGVAINNLAREIVYDRRVPDDVREKIERIVWASSNLPDDIAMILMDRDGAQAQMQDMRDEGLSMAQENNELRARLHALEDRQLRAVQLDDVSIQSLTAPRRAASGE